MASASMLIQRRRLRPSGTVRSGRPCAFLTPYSLVNGYDVGGRQLRVSQADQEHPHSAASSSAATGYHHPNFLGPGPQSHTAATGHGHGQAPSTSSNIPVPPSPESINKSLAGMTNAQLLDILAQMRTMANNNPAATRQLLNANPVLTFTLLQALITLNLVDPVTAEQMMRLSVPRGIDDAKTASTKQDAGAVEHQSPPLTAPSAPPQPTAEQQMIIQHILSLTPDQINAIPSPQREQILQLVSRLSIVLLSF